jgi:putative ABC transport system substrate-binding protein
MRKFSLLGVHRNPELPGQAQKRRPKSRAVVDKPAEALYVTADALANSNRMRINALALAARLPTMYGVWGMVEAGGLMSYSANCSDLFRRASYYADKILRGAKPSDLPVEQPTKFDLVIT